VAIPLSTTKQNKNAMHATQSLAATTDITVDSHTRQPQTGKQTDKKIETQPLRGIKNLLTAGMPSVTTNTLVTRKARKPTQTGTSADQTTRRNAAASKTAIQPKSPSRKQQKHKTKKTPRIRRLFGGKNSNGGE
jgi:hypothetical protein